MSQSYRHLGFYIQSIIAGSYRSTGYPAATFSTHGYFDQPLRCLQSLFTIVHATMDDAYILVGGNPFLAEPFPLGRRQLLVHGPPYLKTHLQRKLLAR
jgi:hypothetical protein